MRVLIRFLPLLLCALAQEDNPEIFSELNDENPSDDILEDMLEDLGIDEVSDVQCMKDSNDFTAANPSVQDAAKNWLHSLRIEGMDDGDSDSPGTIGYGESETKDYKQACDQVGGLFEVIGMAQFSCRPAPDMMEGLTPEEMQPVDLGIHNMAACHANTKECQEFKTEQLLESIWQMFGLDCEEKSGSTVTTIQPSQSQEDGSSDKGNGVKLFFSGLFVGGLLAIGTSYLLKRRREHGSHPVAVVDEHDDQFV